MEIREDIVEELVKNYQSPEEILGDNGLIKQLTKAILERCLQGN